MTQNEKLTAVAESITKRTMELHEGRRTWNPVCGQWLVYGFEAYLGFSGAANLCAVTETAYKRSKGQSPAIMAAVLAELTEQLEARHGRN